MEIGPKPPRDPYENIRSDPIEKDPQKKEHNRSLVKRKKQRSFLIAHFFAAIKKIAQALRVWRN